MAGTEPTVTNASARPSAAFDAPVFSWMAGRTAAQAPQKAPKTPNAACVTAALRCIPVGRQGRLRPLGIRPPVLPAVAERRLPALDQFYNAVALGPDFRRQLGRHDFVHDRITQLVLVFPLPPART